MIVTVDAGTRELAGAMIIEAWKLGIETEKLYGHQLEFTCARDEKVTGLLKKFPSAKILHTELVKEI